jgi:hypothetical protein
MPGPPLGSQAHSNVQSVDLVLHLRQHTLSLDNKV